MHWWKTVQYHSITQGDAVSIYCVVIFIKNKILWGRGEMPVRQTVPGCGKRSVRWVVQEAT